MRTINWPAVKVEVAFTTDPNGASAGSPTWTDISNRVLSISYARTGRTDELGYYQAGTAQLDLDNSSGEFNVSNASGPHFGNLKVYRPIRITATWLGVTYPLWQGYVERWPQTWDMPTFGVCPIECVDAFALLAQITLDSALAAEVLADAPTVYFPLGEDSTSSTAGNASANAYSPASIIHTKTVNLAVPGTYSFGQPLDVVGAASQTGIQFTGTNNRTAGLVDDGYALELPRIPINWAHWTVEFWFQAPTTPEMKGELFVSQNAVDFTPRYGPFSLAPAGQIIFRVSNSPGDLNLYTDITAPDGGYIFNTPVASNVADGKPHHFAATWTPGVLTVYLDGNLVSTTNTSTASTSTVTTTQVAMIGAAAINAQTVPGATVYDGLPLIGTMAHVAVYPIVLSAARIAAHWSAGATGVSGETSGARATRLLSYGAWQSVLQTIETGRSTMSPASGIAGSSLLQELQNVADAELGTLTVTADGKVDVNGRDHRILQTAPTITFGVPAGGLPYQLDSSFKFDFDPTYVYNDVQISRPNGAAGLAADGTSILEYFPRQLPKTMNVDTDDQTQQAASFELGRYKEPSNRLESVTVDAGAIDAAGLPAAWPALLAMDLHQRTRMAHSPLGSGAVTMDGFVEQLGATIDYRPDSFGWKIGFQLSPVLQDYAIWNDAGTLWDSAVWAF